MRIRVVLGLASVLIGGVATAGSASAAPPHTVDPGAVRAFVDRGVPGQLQRLQLQLPGASP